MTDDESSPAPAAVVTNVLIGGLGLIGIYVLWSSLPWPLIHDAPIMHYVAERIAGGAVPYRDLFDMNQPGVYLVHLVVLRVLGGSDLAWRVFDLAWLAVTAVLAARFARPWGLGAAAGAAALVSVYHLASGAWQAGQRDFVLCAFLLAASLATARYLEGSAGATGLALAGLALGAGIVLKPHAASSRGSRRAAGSARGARSSSTICCRSIRGSRGPRTGATGAASSGSRSARRSCCRSRRPSGSGASGGGTASPSSASCTGWRTS
ncbi:MAG: hypothetical protein HYU41_04345 [Candidatus Rokubacteria bacterium]|nr:hypothetical protein [Candidatus Rokubacteria bacterium]